MLVALKVDVIDDTTPLDAIDDKELIELVRCRCCFGIPDADDILCGDGLGALSKVRGFETGAEGAGM